MTFFITAPAATGVGLGEATGVGVGVGVCEAEVDEPLTPPQPIMRARKSGLNKNTHTRLKTLTPLHLLTKREAFGLLTETKQLVKDLKQFATL